MEEKPPKVEEPARASVTCPYCEHVFQPPGGLVVAVFPAGNDPVVQCDECISGYSDPRLGYFPLAIFRLGESLPPDKWPARPLHKRLKVAEEKKKE
jgi:hypothetical protein